jgi:hypothetical protein
VQALQTCFGISLSDWRVVVVVVDVVVISKRQRSTTSIMDNVVNGHSVIWFFVGSIFGLSTAIWDVWDELLVPPKSDDDNDSCWEWLYQSLLLLAPLFYLLEAIIEIASNHSGSIHRFCWNDFFFAVGAICELTATSLAILVYSSEETTDATTTTASNHSHNNINVSDVINLISTHAYLINGAMGLVQHYHHAPFCCAGMNQYQSMLLSGDVLFAMGAMIDWILSFMAIAVAFNNNKNTSWALVMECFNLVSATCWCTNAILYWMVWWRWHNQHHHNVHLDNTSSNGDEAQNDDDLATPLLSSSDLEEREPPSSTNNNSESSSGSIRHRTAKSYAIPDHGWTAPRWIVERPHLV